MMYKKTIILNSESTIEVMKWIADNPELAIELDHTYFANQHGRIIFICSRISGDLFDEDEFKIKIKEEGVEFYGVHRYFDDSLRHWYLLFNDDIYLLTA